MVTKFPKNADVNVSDTDLRPGRGFTKPVQSASKSCLKTRSREKFGAGASSTSLQQYDTIWLRQLSRMVTVMSKVMRKPIAKSSLSVRGELGKTARRVTTFAGNLNSTRARASKLAKANEPSRHASPAVPGRVPAKASPRQITFDRLAGMSQQARERAVTAGLPATLLDRAAAKLGLSQRAFLAALKIAPTTVARNKAAGNALSVDDSDRVARLAQLWHDAMMVFGHEEGTRAWLTGRVPVLDAIPLELVPTSQGFSRAHTAILQLAYGVYA